MLAAALPTVSWNRTASVYLGFVFNAVIPGSIASVFTSSVSLEMRHESPHMMLTVESELESESESDSDSVPVVVLSMRMDPSAASMSSLGAASLELLWCEVSE